MIVNGAGMEWDLKSAGGDKMITNMYYCEWCRDVFYSVLRKEIRLGTQYLDSE